ncbi:Dyp-type peroxidase [Phytohabitans sp. LJ34]|uniref:Dyp-type peroxidase n=1 Tax=Phytohabitans sp. LJ34 TaxID=3452217 RepID=UPI003F894358
MRPVPRRTVLGVAVTGSAVLAACEPGADAAPAPAPPRPEVPHQDGILTPPPDAAVFAAYDVTAKDRDGLRTLLSGLGERMARVRGGTVTVAVGASLFDGRYGLERHRPARLTEMPAFRNDVLDPAWCHGDLLLQVCAGTPKLAATILADVTGGGAAVKRRWRIDGHRPENRTDGPAGRPSTRNLFGFREGAGNPDAGDAALMDRLVWTQPGGGEPAWTAGGTYQVVRLIRMSLPLWDADPVPRQEAAFGRHRADGAVLGRGREDEEPDYAADADGRTVPLDAHIRRANPRTPETDGQRILRRGYSYRRGTDASGHPDVGLVFVSFQQDVERGFATVQRRLAGEALEKYVLPFGGGYFFALPGGAPLGASLLS